MSGLLKSLAMVLLLALCAWGPRSLAQESGQSIIQIKPVVEVDGKRDITLGDLVEFRGVSEEVAAAIRDVRLADAPGPGETRSFTDVGLSQILRVHLREVTQKTGEVPLFRIPSRVTVVRKTFHLKPQDVEANLRDQFKSICGECGIEISNLSVPAVGNKMPASARWSIKTRPELPRGSFSYPLEIAFEDGTKRMFWVSGSVVVRKTVPVASRTISIGEKIAAEDFSLQSKDVTFAIDAPATAAEISASIASRQIAAGQIVWRNELRKELAVRSGDALKVVAGSEGWQVTIDGVAQSNGYVGDLIRVKIPRTQKTVSGLLKEKGTVEVQ